MDAFSFFNSTSQVITDAFESVSQKPSYDDFALLPLVVLGTSFVLNRGSILPRKKDPSTQILFKRPQESLGHATGPKKSKSRNVADLVREKNASLVVLWGSQSGIAEGFAHRIAREAHQRFRLDAVVADLADYDPQSIMSIPEATLAIFVMSTFGEGDPSDNALEFVSWARATKVELSHLQFAAFGCGNSNYRYFNKTIDEVATALVSFGASSIVPVGYGNEATRTTEEDFIEWKDSVFSVLAEKRGLEEVEPNYEPEVDVVMDDAIKATDLHVGRPFHKAHGSSKNTDVVSTPIIGLTELACYPDEGGSCVEVKVDLTAHPQVKYKSGDHLAVWAENSTGEVDQLLRVLGIEDQKSAQIHIHAKPGNDSSKVPSPTTIENLFRYYLEICSPVPRETVLAVSRMTDDENVREELQAFSKDRQTYSAFLKAHHLTFSRLLALGAKSNSMAWKTLPLSFIIDMLPAMQPRLYSISSSRIISPRHVAITVAVKPSILDTSPNVVRIPGLSSSFLSKTRADSESSLRIQVRSSTFRLPVNEAIPLIMVAAGTGIAPFRAFLQERARLAFLGKEVGHMVLFFGCRDESDYLYSEELEEIKSGALKGKLEVVTAFSRTDNKKVYVQDRITERRQEVVSLMHDQDAAFYICGSAIMAKSVGEKIKEAVKEIKGSSDGEVDAWRSKRKKEKRWFEDVWS